MPLADLSLAIEAAELPGDVAAFLAEADRRINRFQFDSHIPGFVTSEFGRVYWALRALAAASAAPGVLFCEWGSGFGVVACLAAMLDFDACGIEIEPELVDAARQLAADFDIPAEFFCGSFIPTGSAAAFKKNEGFSWLNAEESHNQEESGLGPADYDVVFVYPWPDEERLVAELFERHAACGALLISYHGGDDIRLRRKTSRGRSRSRG